MNMPNVDDIIKRALNEDAAFSDATTLSVIAPQCKANARIIAKQPGIVCGLSVAAKAFKALDPRVVTSIKVKDGSRIKAGNVLALISGPARAIISGERTALNFLQHLSGIATLTRRFVDLVKGTGVKIYDTRKTIPGLRSLAKYAVKCGGGVNYRMNLADMAMLKDNHVSLMGGGLGIRASVGAIRKKYPKLKIIVECDNLIQLRSALDARADTVMLDNMLPAQIRKAVDIVRTRKNKRPLIEVSGGITITNVRKYALKGIDYISVGAITHSAPALDISLDIN